MCGVAEKDIMKRLIVFVFLMAIIALPADVLGAPDKNKEVGHVREKKEKKEKKEKSVPEPSTMLLLAAAAAGLIGARKLRRPHAG